MRTTIKGRPLAMAAVMLLTLGGFALPAVADPTDAPSQQQVDAARAAADAKAGTVDGVQARLDAANARLEAAELRASEAAEAANGAIWRHEEAKAAAAEAAAAEKAAQERLVGHKKAYTDLIARTYEQQPQLHALNALTSKSDPQQAVDSASTTYQLTTAMDNIETGYQVAAAEAHTASVSADQAREVAASAAARATAARAQAQASADAAAAEAASVAQEKDALLQEIARLQNISVELATQRQAALEEARRLHAAAAAKAAADARAKAAADKAAADKAAADKAAASQPGTSAPKPPAPSTSSPASQPTTPASSSDPAPVIDPTPPAPAGGVDSVIAYAKAQLGEPYEWAAAGPDTWDCSGLTMMSWREAGKYLPHFSGAQYDAGTPIAISAAQPGDLLFWTSNGRASGIHHVALYIGNGQYIHAPRAGKDVEIKSLSYWYPDLAVRL